MTCGIYAIINKKNKKIYIGLSKDIEKRFKEHKRDLKGNYHRNRHLQNSYNKYGIENFIFKIMEECLESQLNEKEIFWINYFSRKYEMYNIAKGGSSGVIPKKSVKKRNLASARTRSTTGVLYVSRNKSHRKSRPFLYVYEKDNISFSKTDFIKLKEEAIKRGKEWIILDEKKYHSCILNNYFVQKGTPNPDLPYISTDGTKKGKTIFSIRYRNKRITTSFNVKKLRKKLDNIIKEGSYKEG